MAEISKTPAFNLGVVTQETGIHPDTLRAWERRYGLPNPARTEGRHRLYSQHDIDTIRWLLARQDEGMSISKAVKLWQTLQEKGSDPLEDNTLVTSLPPKLTDVGLPTEAQIDDLRTAWVTACLNFDESRAEQVVAYAFALFPAEVVCFDIFFTGLSEIGQAWYRGEATVQQEHFASGLVQRRIDALIAAAPPQLHPETVVVGCPPNEEHVLPALMMSLLLRNRGWGVVYLGADVPVANLGEMIASVQPVLTVLTAHRLVAASELLDVALALDKQRIPMTYGGWIFGVNPGLREVIPGYYLGDNLRNAAYEVEKKILKPALPLSGKAPQSKSDLLKYYSVIRIAVESRLREMLTEQIDEDYLQIANHYWSEIVFAALKLGDIGYLASELAWITGFLQRIHVPVDALALYVEAYRKAMIEILHDRAEPIEDWLNTVDWSAL